MEGQRKGHRREWEAEERKVNGRIGDAGRGCRRGWRGR